MLEYYPQDLPSRGILPFAPENIMPIIADENDVGIPAIRARSTTPRKLFTFQLEFTQGEWDAFLVWVRYNLNNGIAYFYFPQPDNWSADTNTWEIMRFCIEKMNNSVYSNLEWTDNNIRITTMMERINV